MQHHTIHPSAKFEGYYNKFDLASGSHIVLVLSQVRNANQNGNAFTFTYIPKDATKSPIYQKEMFVDEFYMKPTHENEKQGGNGFMLEMPGIGSVKHLTDDTTIYSIDHSDFSLHATSTSRLAWPTSNQTPEGFFVNLPLPLHWHVQSLTSRIDNLTLKISDYEGELPAADASTTALLHQEKNWATSFPSAHIWVQARNAKEGTVLNIAGGKILGAEAFLIGYRSPDLDLSFRPPWALKFLGFGPFMSYTVDWESRTFELSVQSWRQKIEVRATAPKGTFFSLAAPFKEGHRPNFLNQSLQARVELKIYTRGPTGWFGGAWQLVREETFENGGLEFGAGYYPLAGSESRFN